MKTPPTAPPTRRDPPRLAEDPRAPLPLGEALRAALGREPHDEALRRMGLALGLGDIALPPSPPAAGAAAPAAGTVGATSTGTAAATSATGAAAGSTAAAGGATAGLASVGPILLGIGAVAAIGMAAVVGAMVMRADGAASVKQPSATVSATTAQPAAGAQTFPAEAVEPAFDRSAPARAPSGSVAPPRRRLALADRNTSPGRADRHPQGESSASTNGAGDGAWSGTAASERASAARAEAAPAPIDEAPFAVAPPDEPAGQAAASRLRAEAALVRRAEKILAGDPLRALALTEERRTRFPAGALAEEAEVVAIDALLLLGRLDEAHARARAFEAQHPASVHTRRLRQRLDRAERR